MDDFDLEVQDIRDTDPEHFNGSVTTAGTPVSITPTNAKPIQLALVSNPKKGPNANATNDVLLVNIDGTTVEMALARGEKVYFPGIFNTLSVDSNNNSVNYEVIVWS